MNNTSESPTIITPTMAAEWIKLNTINRPLNHGKIADYACDMKNGKWQYNGETIKISCDNRILDGQHRLLAIIRADVPIKILVVRGLAADSFKTIDTGMRRSAAQILGLSGKKHSTIQAAIGRWIILIETKTNDVSSRKSVTTQEIFDVLVRHPMVPHFASTISSNRSIRGLLPSASGAAVVLAAEKYGQDIVENFLAEFSDGQGLKKGDPAYELRERMIQNSSRVAKLTTSTIVAITIKALRAYATNKTIGVLRWSTNEEWPEV